MMPATVAAPTGFARLRWQWAIAWRASRVTAGVALAGGFVLRLILPVDNAWLALAVAGAAATVAVLLFVTGTSAPPATRDTMAALETMGTGEQLGQAFARTSVLLAAFWLGLAVGRLNP